MKTNITVSLSYEAADLLRENTNNISAFIEEIVMDKLGNKKKKLLGELNRIKRELEIEGFDIDLSISERD